MSTHVFKPDMPPPVQSRRRGGMDARQPVLQLAQHPADPVCVLPGLADRAADAAWAILDANWVGTTRADCTKEGACWVFIQQRFGQFMYGYYPANCAGAWT
jgi:general L-amino acid transport system permease protein